MTDPKSILFALGLTSALLTGSDLMATERHKGTIEAAQLEPYVMKIK